LDKFPLILIGCDFNEVSLEETRHTLYDLDQTILIWQKKILETMCEKITHFVAYLMMKGQQFLLMMMEMLFLGKI